jgi:hypothetical protein
MDKSISGSHLVVYGHLHCSSSRWLKQELEDHHVAFEWRDVNEGESRFRDELRTLAQGCLSVATVILPDGIVMIEPRPSQVLKKLQSLPEASLEPAEPNHATLLARLLRRRST